MMKIQYRIIKLLTVSAFILMCSLALAADVVRIFPYQIGYTGPAGGIVFWVSGDGKHGLEAAPSDQGEDQWYNGDFILTNAVRDGIYAGQFNTERIVAKQGPHIHANYAALLCANYQGGGYADWYLPSKQELNLLYLQKDIVGGFAGGNYWSSNEFSIAYAEMQEFSSGVQGNRGKDTGLKVRAIRAF